MKKNLFPLFLDGATQALSAAEAATWNGKTSFVSLDNNGIGTFTLGEVAEGNEPIEPGTVVSVYRSASGTTNIEVLPKAGESALLGLNGATESAVFMWDASAWKIVSNATASGTVSTSNLALTGTLSVAGVATFDDPAHFDSGSATELTSRATGVTVNEPAGIVTTDDASLVSGTEATLTVTNSAVTATDMVMVTPLTNCEELSYFHVDNISAGSFDIEYAQGTGSDSTKAYAFQFLVVGLA